MIVLTNDEFDEIVVCSEKMMELHENIMELECEVASKNKEIANLEDFKEKFFEIESQLKSELKLNNSLSSQLNELKIWEFFFGFLLDEKEGETISEESLQQLLVQAIKKLKGEKEDGTKKI